MLPAAIAEGDTVSTATAQHAIGGSTNTAVCGAPVQRARTQTSSDARIPRSSTPRLTLQLVHTRTARPSLDTVRVPSSGRGRQSRLRELPLFEGPGDSSGTAILSYLRSTLSSGQHTSEGPSNGILEAENGAGTAALSTGSCKTALRAAGKVQRTSRLPRIVERS
jgi:hypothetical protein